MIELREDAATQTMQCFGQAGVAGDTVIGGYREKLGTIDGRFMNDIDLGDDQPYPVGGAARVIGDEVVSHH
jgi:hypothetical protein